MRFIISLSGYCVMFIFLILISLRSIKYYCGFLFGLSKLGRKPFPIRNLFFYLYHANIIYIVQILFISYKYHLYRTNVIYIVPMSFISYKYYLYRTNIICIVQISFISYKIHLVQLSCLSVAPHHTQNSIA